VSVPLVAYEDLGEPNLLGGFSVLEMDDQIVLHIEGGDGEAAYKARLVLVNGQLDRRELQTYDADGEWITRTDRFQQIPMQHPEGD